MANPQEQAPAPLEEVSVPVAPVIVNGVEEYQSSEEFQRAHAVGLAKKAEEEAKAAATTDKQKLHAVLDKYIKKHQTTKAIRARLKESGKPVTGRNLEVQFEVSDAIATELTKIKNELR